ncbi:MAG: hypothetical protein K8S16_16845 [Bacteroidales bacterium]|nr:hypothetical protein [Bacteroidales bacterium]
MLDFGKCAETTNHREEVFKERKSKITFNNPNRKRIRKVYVQCLKLEGKSCDGLLIELENKNIEHFVELKGSHVTTAIKQIENTIRKISSNQKKQKKFSYIISTKSPRIDSAIQKIKHNFKKNYNSALTINTGHYSINI